MKAPLPCCLHRETSPRYGGKWWPGDCRRTARGTSWTWTATGHTDVSRSDRATSATSQTQCPSAPAASANSNTYTHKPPFNDPLSGTTGMIRYQKGKTNLDFTEARDSEWQWHQLGHMQVCTSLQTNNHASTPSLSFLQAAAQPTVSKQWRQQDSI